MLLCPPATLIAQMTGAAKGSVTAGSAAQDCHAKAVQGAHTGDIAASRC
jgi:triosephosphate isomerase